MKHDHKSQERTVERDPWLGVELRHLAALLAVARTGSFRRAADELGYVQSAISQQIAFLEQLVGTRVVERTRGMRGVAMTEAGEALLVHAEKIIGRFHAARADLDALANDERPVLRLGLPHGVAAGLLPPVLRQLAIDAPVVRITATESAREEPLLQALERGDLDAVLAELPVSSAALATLALLPDPHVLIVESGSRIAQIDRPLNSDDLRDLPLVVHAALPGIETHLRARGAEPWVAFRSDSTATVESMVAAGVGGAIVPTLALGPPMAGTVRIGVGELLPRAPSGSAGTATAAARPRSRRSATRRRRCRTRTPCWPRPWATRRSRCWPRGDAAAARSAQRPRPRAGARSRRSASRLTTARPQRFPHAHDARTITRKGIRMDTNDQARASTERRCRDGRGARHAQARMVRFAPTTKGLQVVPKSLTLPHERLAAGRVATEINGAVAGGLEAAIVTSTLAELVALIHGKRSRPLPLEQVETGTPIMPLGAAVLSGRQGHGLDRVCRAVDTVVGQRPLCSVTLMDEDANGRWLAVAWRDIVVEDVTVTANGRLHLGRQTSRMLDDSVVEATTEWNESTVGVPGGGPITWQIGRSLYYEFAGLAQRLLNRATAFD